MHAAVICVSSPANSRILLAQLMQMMCVGGELHLGGGKSLRRQRRPRLEWKVERRTLQANK